MTISIADYDKAEAEAITRLSYPQIQAFQPTYFRSIGVPTNVTCEKELFRYVDMMGEVSPIEDIMEGRFYTGEEQREIITLSDQIKNLTKQMFGRQITPIAGLFAPWPVLRMIEHLQAHKVSPLNVFEVAPGCGYLGAYLINRGYLYNGMEVTQAFYLWQNRLWRAISESFSDWAQHHDHHDGDGYRVQHMPWWMYSNRHYGPERHDLVVCEAALGEMTDRAMRYTLHLAAKMLHDSPLGCLLYTNTGEGTAQSDIEHIAVHECGFRWRRIGGVTMLLGRSFKDKVLDNIDHPPHLGDGPVKQPKDFYEFGELPDNYEFFRFIGIAQRRKDPQVSFLKRVLG